MKGIYFLTIFLRKKGCVVLKSSVDYRGVYRLFDENTETGEFNELDLREYRIINRRQERVIQDSRKVREMIALKSDYPFVWAIYKSSTLLMGELPGAHVTMLFYLITYCGYDGRLTTGKQPVLKDGVKDLLGVSRSTADRFWSSVSGMGICSENDCGEIIVNSNFFRRGRLGKREVAEMSGRDEYATKVYIKAIRELYRASTSSSKKTLCYLFQIIPFLNREYNIICHNPLEKNLDDISPMNLGEFCRVVGYSEENSSRLLSSLLASKFTTKDGVESAVRYVVSDRLRDKRSYNMFVNPNVYYAGTCWDEVKVLGKF